ncbi:MAG: triose-phosphate isomerase [Deltaproteobacteria bacterium]
MTARSRILAANWKMNKTVSETVEFCQIFKNLYKTNPKKSRVKLVIAPPFTSLAAAKKGLEGTGVHIASQNMHWEKSGAFTGEISASMLKELGVEYLILGHSERRQLFLETDGMVNQKIKRGLEERFLIIFCIGETLEERNLGKTPLVLERQLEKGFQGIEKAALKNIVVAYEPVWAIGTGKNATADQAEEAHVYIRKILAKRFNKESAEGISILYGGSVNADNFSEISRKPNVDGALVGGASLDPKSFIEILERMA